MNAATATRTRYGVLEERSEGFGGHGGGAPPVPIPNTEVKPASADGTWTEGSRESRTPPNISEGRPSHVRGAAFLRVRGVSPDGRLANDERHIISDGLA